MHDMNPPSQDEQPIVTGPDPGGGSAPAAFDPTDEAPTDAPPTHAGTIRDRLGPILIVSRLKRPIVGRFWALGIAIACGAILGLSASLQPNPNGYGTHTQFGLGPCGFMLQTGYPCPTCGMTTAYADLVHGHALRSVLDQPMGFVLALATAIVGVIALAAAFSGRTVWVNWYRVNPVRVVWAFVVLFVASWGFKILFGLATGALPAR